MGGVDCGDHNMWMVPVFANVSHFLKWYKKAFLGLTDVSLLQVIVAWNLEMNIPDIPRRGRHPKFRELKRWLFYSISSKEMMIYVDNKEKKTLKGCKQKQPCTLPHQYEIIIIIRY